MVELESKKKRCKIDGNGYKLLPINYDVIMNREKCEIMIFCLSSKQFFYFENICSDREILLNKSIR